MPNPKGPCLGCEDRKLGCHSGCEKYLSFSQKCAELRDYRYKLSELQHPTENAFRRKMWWDNNPNPGRRAVSK